MQFAGTDANVDTDPQYLSRLAASRKKGESVGPYCIRTYPSRTLFDLAKPKEADVHIEDIAHSLSIEPRFGGHLPIPWSVAQHSVLVAYIANCNHLPRQHYGAALLHDAHEAYIKDLPTPLKNLLGPVYRNIASGIQACIHRALGIPELDAESVRSIKRADALALEIEQQAIERGDMVVRLARCVTGLQQEQYWNPKKSDNAHLSFIEEWHRWRTECSLSA